MEIEEYILAGGSVAVPVSLGGGGELLSGAIVGEAELPWAH